VTLFAGVSLRSLREKILGKITVRPVTNGSLESVEDATVLVLVY
jgi:hypothetical protein